MGNNLTQLLSLSRSGMLARLMDLDAVSHNLANVNTNGYKMARVNFQELLNQSELNALAPSSTQNQMNPGTLRGTGNPLDLAIEGEGFFAVTLPDGRTAYTRDGAFLRDANNAIVNSAGLRLVWDGQLPAAFDDVHVNPDGAVMVKQGANWTQAGQIPLTRFANPTALQGYGENAWLETDASGPAEAGLARADGLGTIHGNTLESSNVNMAEEMTHMIALQRAYSLSVRAFQQSDQMFGLAVQMRR
jgi:flagellar basal-body rod protein FlgG